MHFAVGNRGHLVLWSTGPEDGADRDAIIAQWCFPSRRQQGGRFEAGSEVDNAGPISDKLKTANNAAAETRRTDR